MAFKSLVSAVSEQCQEIKQALASFAHFETWEPELIGECCRVSSIAEFPPDRIILAPETGNSHTVYFILEGVCKMVQHMHVKIKKGSTGFCKDSNDLLLCKRYRYSDSKALNSELKTAGFKSKLLNLEENFPAVKITDNGKGVEKGQNVESPSGELQEAKQETEEEPEVLMKKSEEITPRDVDVTVENMTKLENADSSSHEEFKPEPTDEEDTKITEYEPNHHIKILEECKKRRNETISVCKREALPEKRDNVRSVFVQTVFLLKGACFGLEKCDSFIMSVTRVKCLKIPQRFLLKHNPCNIWNRIRLFHSLYLPKEDRIFENFRTDRLWTEWKKKLSKEIVSTRNIPNYTLRSDVPYSIRLVDWR